MAQSHKDLKTLQREHNKELFKATHPPGGGTWVDYATRHQHVGGDLCWQCISREKALAEHEALVQRIVDLEIKINEKTI